MITKITSTLALSLLLFSCNNSGNETEQNNPKELTEKEHHHDEESQNIELNNGEKWKVDAAMMVHIRNMEKDVNDFQKSENKDYSVLSKKLLKNINLLTSNCTMKGKAHDELHKWLLPFIDLVDEFGTAKDDKVAAEHLNEIQASFKTFNEYFQ